MSTQTQTIKAQILDDIADGTVPVTVATFSELHDFVDANSYGDLLGLDNAEANSVMDEVDAWLRGGRP